MISALGQNIGIEPSIFNRIDFNQLVSDAILVREGRLSRVPQQHMLVEGIWPPELVPLFLKEGYLPGFADDDGEINSTPNFSTTKKEFSRQSSIKSIKKFLSRENSTSSAIRRSSRANSVNSKRGEKLTVRFEDVSYHDENQADFEASSVQHWNPKFLTVDDSQETDRISDRFSIESFPPISSPNVSL